MTTTVLVCNDGVLKQVMFTLRYELGWMQLRLLNGSARSGLWVDFSLSKQLHRCEMMNRNSKSGRNDYVGLF